MAFEATLSNMMLQQADRQAGSEETNQTKIEFLGESESIKSNEIRKIFPPIRLISRKENGTQN